VRYVKGGLTNVHKSAVVPNMILEESQWFTPDSADVGQAYKDVYKHHKQWMIKAKKQGYKNRTEFSYESMRETLKKILDTIPVIPKQVEIQLPKLQLPKLKKI
jgi:hypothetical protein